MRNRFLATYLLELRLMCLHWGYGLLLALFSLWVISTVTTFESDVTAKQLLLVSLPRGIIAIVSLGILFLAAISVSRPVRNRIEALEMSFPTGAEITLGRMSAVMTAAAGFLIAPLVLGLMAGPFSDFISSLPAFFRQTLLIFGLCTVIVWVVHIKIGVKRWVYPLFALLWLGSAMSNTLNMHQFPWALLLSFPTYAASGSSNTSLWGMLRESSTPQWVTVFYVGLTLLLLSLIIWWAIRQRSHRLSWITMVGMAIGLVVALMGGISYSSGIMTAYAQSREIDQFIVKQDASFFTLPADTPYTATSYDIALDFADQKAPSYSVKMDIINTGDQSLSELTFALNHQLEVSTVNIPYERDWDYVRLLPEQPLAPGESLSVEIAYRGGIWWYSGETAGRPPYATYFTRLEGVNLACSIAWYPIPGNILVGREFYYPSRQTPDCILAQPAAFTVHVENPGDLHFASNLPASDDAQTFSANAATWVHLLAAPELVTETIGEITVNTAQPDLELARSAAENYYTPALAYLRQFFPEIQHVNLFAADEIFSQFFYSAAPENENILTVTVDPYNLRVFSRSPFGEHLYVQQAMIESLLGQGSTTLAENVAYFLWAYEKGQTDPAQMQMLLNQDIPQGDAGTQRHYGLPLQERYKIAFALFDVYQEKGEAGLKSLLKQIRADAATLSPLEDGEIISWIKDTAHA